MYYVVNTDLTKQRNLGILISGGVIMKDSLILKLLLIVEELLTDTSGNTGMVDIILKGDIEATPIKFSHIFDDEYMELHYRQVISEKEKVSYIEEVVDYLLTKDLLAFADQNLIKKSAIDMDSVETFYQVLKGRLQSYYSSGADIIPYKVSVVKLQNKANKLREKRREVV